MVSGAPKVERRGGKRSNPGGRPKGSLSKSTLVRQAAEARRMAAIAVDAERVIEELAAIAFSNMQDFVHPDGSYKGIHELTRQQAAAIGTLDTLKRNVEAGDGHTDRVDRIKLWDKPKALEMLGKRFALFTDVVKVSTDETRLARLLAGRQRAAKKGEK